MADVLTDADIARMENGHPVLSDADISGHEQGQSHPIAEGAANLASGFAQGLNPFHGLGDTIEALKKDPGGTGLRLLEETFAHPYMAIGRAIDAAKQGKGEEAAAHLSTAFIPAGGNLEESAVKMATPGQRMEGLGQAGGIGTGAAIAAVAPKIPGVVGAAAGKALDVLPETDQTTRDVVGVLSPRVKNALGVLDKAKQARQVYKDAQAAKAPAALDAGAALDEIAKSLGGVPFESMTQAGQMVVRRIFDESRGVSPPAMSLLSQRPSSTGPIDIGADHFTPKSAVPSARGPLRPPMDEVVVNPELSEWKAPQPGSTPVRPPVQSVEGLSHGGVENTRIQLTEAGKQAASAAVDAKLSELRATLLKRLGIEDTGPLGGKAPRGTVFDEGSGARQAKPKAPNLEKQLKMSIADLMQRNGAK